MPVQRAILQPGVVAAIDLPLPHPHRHEAQQRPADEHMQAVEASGEKKSKGT